MPNKHSLSLAAATISLMIFTGCSMAYGDASSQVPLVTQDVADSESALATLRWADEIVLQKAAVSLNDWYAVTADDVPVGEIRGQYIYTLGDTFSLFSEAGNLIESEGEGYRVVNHTAKLYDYNNEPLGEIKENLHLFLTNWTIYDAAGVELGNAQQNVSLVLNFTVKNAAGVDEYQITKTILSMGARITITPLTSEATIPVMNAIWLAAIANELAEAE